MAYRFGRRKVFFLFLGVQSAMGIGTAFAPTFTTFAVIRLAVGLTTFAVSTTPGKLALELAGRRHHVRILLLISASKGVGALLLSGVAFLIRDWSHLALSTSVPFAAFLLYWWVLPESPRWLLSRGRYEVVGHMLTSISQTNGKCLPPEFLINMKRNIRIECAIQCEREDFNPAGYGFGDLLQTPNLRKKTLLITLIWFLNTTVCMGLTYYAFEISHRIHLNFFLSSLAEVAAVALVALVLERSGRRCALCLSSSLGGVMCLCIYGNQSGTTVPLLLYFVSKVGISTSCAVLPIWAGELLPTVVRDVGLEVIELISLLGPALLPFLMYQGKKHAILPLCTLGGLQLFAGLLALLLPETSYHRAAQSLQEAEDFGKYSSWKDCLRFKPRKAEPRNGILKNKGPTQQSPILSLLRRQESLRRGSSEVEEEASEDLGHSSSMGPIKITVL